MNEYELYEIEDFIKDDFFIEWVLVPEKEHEEFWTQWLATHPHRTDRVARAKQILQSLRVVPTAAKFSAEDLSAILASVDEGTTAAHRSAKAPLLNWRRWLTAAAILVVLTGLAFFYFTLNQPAPNAPMAKTGLHVVAVSDSVKTYNSSNDKKVIKLDDGSVVILTPHSELSYNSGFNNQSRDVTLNGEAFFDVKHNPEKPFVIYSHGIATKVVGTSFTIRSFAKEDEYHITVNTGKVQVREVTGSDKSVVLLPNQQLTYLHSAFKFKESTVRQPLPLSENEAIKSFSFSNTPFNEVMQKLEDVYHVKIHYDKEKYASYSITASLSALPLDEKIKMMCKVVNAACSYRDGDIFIY